MAGYPLDGPAPPWDVCYPEDSSVLQALSHAFTKRASPPYRHLGITGEPFAPGGGGAGAWTAANRTARRILAEENR